GEVALVEGWNAVEVAVADRAGNVTTEKRRVYRDTRAPTLTVARLPATTEQEEITITGTVDEDGCEVDVSGGDVRESKVEAKVVTVRIGLARGRNEITLSARDPAQNASREERVVVSFEPPVSGTVESINARWGLVVVRLAAGMKAAEGQRLRIFRGDQEI